MAASLKHSAGVSILAESGHILVVFTKFLRGSTQSLPEINYDASADLISLPSYGVAGVATNSRGNVFVYARAGHAVATRGDERTFYHGGSRLFQSDPNGKFVKETGQGVDAINFAQQVRVDPQDNISSIRFAVSRTPSATCTWPMLATRGFRSSLMKGRSNPRSPTSARRRPSAFRAGLRNRHVEEVSARF